MPLIEQNEEAADALREIGNIAFSHAATALATLVNRRVDISIPAVRVLGREAIEREIYERNESLFVVSFRLAGDHTGIVAVLFPQRDAWALLELLHGRTLHMAELDADAESTLREVGNIMAGSALLALYRMLGTTLLHSTPALYRRTASQVADEHMFASPIALVVEAEFSVEERRARGTMVISPNEPAPLLKRLGIHLEVE